MVNEFAGKKITLIGLGSRTHVALARYLVGRGANVTVSDAKSSDQLKEEQRLLTGVPVRFGLGGHRDEDVLDADLIFVTPGAPRDLPCLVRAQQEGIPLSSEIELLFELCQATIIGITGSSGKTTTTTLVGKMCEAAGFATFVGGNIGTPLIDRVEDIPASAFVVLELSSFQLEYLHRSPQVGAILNITPNHLDRHGTLERYARAKFNILAHQSSADAAILGIDDPQTRRLLAHCPGAVLEFSRQQRVTQGTWLEHGRLMLTYGDGEESICSVGDLKLRGQHNVGNVLAAAAIATAAGIALPAVQEVVTSFTGVEHRLEPLRVLDGIMFVNDSIATSPERAVAALRSFHEPVVLLAGGRSKHLPLQDLAALIVEKARGVVLLGEMSDELDAALREVGGRDRLLCCRASDMVAAVTAARKLAHSGDVVLLSPGGTSFDMFRDFEERGLCFKKAVMDLV